MRIKLSLFIINFYLFFTESIPVSDNFPVRHLRNRNDGIIDRLNGILLEMTNSTTTSEPQTNKIETLENAVSEATKALEADDGSDAKKTAKLKENLSKAQAEITSAKSEETNTDNIKNTDSKENTETNNDSSIGTKANESTSEDKESSSDANITTTNENDSTSVDEKAALEPLVDKISDDIDAISKENEEEIKKNTQNENIKESTNENTEEDTITGEKNIEQEKPTKSQPFIDFGKRDMNSDDKTAKLMTSIQSLEPESANNGPEPNPLEPPPPRPDVLDSEWCEEHKKEIESARKAATANIRLAISELNKQMEDAGVGSPKFRQLIEKVNEGNEMKNASSISTQSLKSNMKKSAEKLKKLKNDYEEKCPFEDAFKALDLIDEYYMKELF